MVERPFSYCGILTIDSVMPMRLAIPAQIGLKEMKGEDYCDYCFTIIG
jgi:hypothetical protein